MRLIDADAIIEWAREDMQMHIDEYYERKSIEQEKKRFLAIKNAVKHAPTIDAVPVVHGHWVKTIYPNMMLECKCSICGAKDFGMNLPKYFVERNYCPYCGADMRRCRNEYMYS